jgi:hypothetical protein
MSSFATYLIGFIILVIGLAAAAYLLAVPPMWIGVGVIIMIGIGVLMATSRTKTRDPQPGPYPPSGGQGGTSGYPPSGTQPPRTPPTG